VNANYPKQQFGRLLRLKLSGVALLVLAGWLIWLLWNRDTFPLTGASETKALDRRITSNRSKSVTDDPLLGSTRNKERAKAYRLLLEQWQLVREEPEWSLNMDIRDLHAATERELGCSGEMLALLKSLEDRPFVHRIVREKLEERLLDPESIDFRAGLFECAAPGVDRYVDRLFYMAAIGATESELDLIHSNFAECLPVRFGLAVREIGTGATTRSMLEGIEGFSDPVWTNENSAIASTSFVGDFAARLLRESTKNSDDFRAFDKWLPDSMADPEHTVNRRRYFLYSKWSTVDLPDFHQYLLALPRGDANDRRVRIAATHLKRSRPDLSESLLAAIADSESDETRDEF
jgi:hypothetical protein